MPAVAVHDAPLRPVPSGTSVPAPLVGVATWYDAGPGEYAAAGPALRVAGWRGSYVVVCAFPEGRATCLTLPLVDWCACGDRNGLPTLLDLSADAFAQLAPLSQGLVRVTVQEVLP
jgi:expansin (peptidoglycan-binding protein)